MSRAEIYKARSRLKHVIREFFSDYLEVDTPVVVPCPGVETHIRYFPTTWLDHKGKHHGRWLRSSPELHLKQLAAAGIPRLFELGPCFRSGGEQGPMHHPEFWMLEWYRAPCSFESLMRETEEFLVFCFEEMSQKAKRISLARCSTAECFEEFVGVALVDKDPDLPMKLEQAGVLSITPEDDFESAFHKAFLDIIEPKLASMGGVMVYDYPPSMGVLSQVVDGKAKRVETYIHGIELTNGCLELFSRPAHETFMSSVSKKRQSLGYENPTLNEEFLVAADQFSNDLAGTACGFDRLLALLMGQQDLSSSMGFRLFKSSPSA